MLWAGVTVLLNQERDQAGRQAAIQSTDLAYRFEQGAVRIFESVDQTLLSARDEYARNPQHPDLSDWARDRPLTGSLAIKLSVVDANGIVVANNLGPVTSRTDLSDRDAVRGQRLATSDHLIIGVPIIGRRSGKLSITASRRLTTPDGR
jgi:hypothetical protein